MSIVTVIKKTWTPRQTLPDIVKFKLMDITQAEKMFYKFLRRAKEDMDRIYHVELYTIEDDRIRLYRHLEPNKIVTLLPRDTIISR